MSLEGIWCCDHNGKKYNSIISKGDKKNSWIERSNGNATMFYNLSDSKLCIEYGTKRYIGVYYDNRIVWTRNNKDSVWYKVGSVSNAHLLRGSYMDTGNLLSVFEEEGKVIGISHEPLPSKNISFVIETYDNRIVDKKSIVITRIQDLKKVDSRRNYNMCKYMD